MTHRKAFAFALTLVLFAGVASADKLKKMIYWPAFGLSVHENVATFHVEITEKETGRSIATKDFDAPVDQWKSIDAKDGARDIKLRARGKSDGSGEVFFEASENGEKIQSNLVTFSPKPASATKSKYETISLNLKDADIENVLNVFGEITGYDVSVGAGVKGKQVTIEVVDMPWDQALRKIASDNGITITIGEKKIFADR